MGLGAVDAEREWPLSILAARGPDCADASTWPRRETCWPKEVIDGWCAEWCTADGHVQMQRRLSLSMPLMQQYALCATLHLGAARHVVGEVAGCVLQSEMRRCARQRGMRAPDVLILRDLAPTRGARLPPRAGRRVAPVLTKRWLAILSSSLMAARARRGRRSAAASARHIHSSQRSLRSRHKKTGIVPGPS